jgi:hypothetical protein
MILIRSTLSIVMLLPALVVAQTSPKAWLPVVIDLP